MALYNFSRRRPPQRVAGYGAFLDFLESRGAFLSQKCVYEYCRARTGLNWDKLMLEPAFLAACEISRWEAFAAALGDIAVYCEGRLRPAEPLLRTRLADRMTAAVATVLARHPLPAHLPGGWHDELAALRERLAEAQLAPPQGAAAVARTGGARIHAALPLHKDMTKHDRELVTNAVRFNFSRIADDMEAQIDFAAVAEAFLSDSPPLSQSA